MAKARISEVRGKTAVVLPDSIARKLRFLAGETVYVRETSHGLEISQMSVSDQDDLRTGQETLQKYRRNWRYSGS